MFWLLQVYWNSLSRTYWVHWHMIEILGNGSGGPAEKETQEKASSLTETLKLTTGKTEVKDSHTLPHVCVCFICVSISLYETTLFSSVFLNVAVSQTFFSKPPGGLYSLPYLMEGSQNDTSTLSRAEWWEVLFFIKKLEPKQQQEINSILRQSLDEPVLTPSPLLCSSHRVE